MSATIAGHSLGVLLNPTLEIIPLDWDICVCISKEEIHKTGMDASCFGANSVVFCMRMTEGRSEREEKWRKFKQRKKGERKEEEELI